MATVTCHVAIQYIAGSYTQCILWWLAQVNFKKSYAQSSDHAKLATDIIIYLN